MEKKPASKGKRSKQEKAKGAKRAPSASKGRGARSGRSPQSKRPGKKPPAARQAGRKPPPRPPAPKAAPPAPSAPLPAPPDPSRPRALAIAQAGLDKKAEDVVVLDVRGLTSYADYFVVMTADSERQAGAIADHVEQVMKSGGATKVGVEGYESGRWVLVDYGDVVAHVLSREARGFYDLEGLWADAPRVSVA